MKMKKKWITLLAAAIMAFGMVSCGRSEEEKADTKQETSLQKSAEEESVGVTDEKEGVFWETKAVAPPSFGDISVREQEIVDGVSVKITKTPLDYNFDEIEQKLRANTFIADNYKLQKEVCENIKNAESYEEGDFHDYSFSRSICGERLDNMEEKDYYSDFSFTVTTDYANFDNICRVSVYFSGVPEESGIQEGIYSVLKDALGEEAAEYLTYGESEEAKDYELEEYVEYKDSAWYYFARAMEKDKQEGTWDISFAIRLDNLGYVNKFTCFDNDETPMLQGAKYDLKTLTEGNVSGWNLERFGSDMPEYTSIDMGSKFIRNKLQPVRYTEKVTDDGVTTYELFMFGYEQGLLDVPAYECPGIDISYTITEREVSIHSIDVCFEGENIGANIDNSNAEAFYKKVFSVMKEQIILMCPCLNPEEIDFNNLWNVTDSKEIDFDNMRETKNWRTVIPVTYLGKECDCTVSISLSDSCGKWRVEIESK